MYLRTSNRGRPLLILLIVLAVTVFALYYRGGAGLAGGSQRVLLSAIAPLQKGLAKAARPFQRISRYTVKLSRVKAENRTLRTANAKLEDEVAALRRYRAENKRLLKLAGFRAESAPRTLGAHVISRSPTSWQSLATIDIGANDGVKKRLSVLTDGGLVGQIVEVTGGTALVRLLDDRLSGVSVEIPRTGVTGVAEGRMNGGLRLRFIAGDEDVKKGDKVVTSGAGGVYPRGIRVGAVKGIEKTAYSLEKQILMEPAVDYRRLSEVLVIVDRDGPERK